MEIDESSHREAPSVAHKFKNALIAIVLGAVLVQTFYFWGAFRGGNPGTSFSVVRLYDNLYFLLYLGVCAVTGWIAGRRFIDWLNAKIAYWKFW